MARNATEEIQLKWQSNLGEKGSQTTVQKIILITIQSLEMLIIIDCGFKIVIFFLYY